MQWLLFLLWLASFFDHAPQGVHLAFWGGLLGGIASGIASLFGANMQNNANEQQAQNAANFNAAEAQKNRDFQAQQSATAYQRSMADMKKAGLNPMLAFSQGGASTPGGSTASMAAPHMENALGQGISSAFEYRRLKKDLDQTDSNIKLNDAYEAAQGAAKKLSEASAKVAEKNAQVIDAEMPAIKQKARTDAKVGAINEKMAVTDAIMNRVGQGTGIIRDATSVLKPQLNINGWRKGFNPRGGDMIINRKGEIKSGW